ncbi:MAG: hypothetical protein P8M80_07485, partial [Pirellulaceae bacterium]|nr:hypothetical protein [Pirellulaceae bacterium]
GSDPSDFQIEYLNQRHHRSSSSQNGQSGLENSLIKQEDFHVSSNSRLFHPRLNDLAEVFPEQRRAG